MSLQPHLLPRNVFDNYLHITKLSICILLISVSSRKLRAYVFTFIFPILGLLWFQRGELRLSGNHTVTEYEMSSKPYSQKSGLKNHTNQRILQVMTRL